MTHNALYAKGAEVFKRIRSYSPKEVYALSVVYFLTLFLNFSELFSSRIEFGDIFEIRHSIVYGLIRGIADNNLRTDAVLVLYWVILITLVLLVALKAKRISEWLWQR